MLGDSKSVTPANTWPTLLQSNLASATLQPAPTYSGAISGATVATTLANITNILNGAPYQRPESYQYVLINLGVNDDNSGLPVEATWESNYKAILDAIHARWPDALVYLSKPWERNNDSNMDVIAGWIDHVVASKSYARNGHDERIWMKGSDNGATYTTDGIHPNTAAQSVLAAQWLSALGY